MFQKSTEQLFTVFGLLGTYESEVDFTEKDITVLVNNHTFETERQPEIQFKTADVEVMVSEVPEPRIGDMITFKETQYQISEVVSGDEYTWNLTLNEDISA